MNYSAIAEGISTGVQLLGTATNMSKINDNQPIVQQNLNNLNAIGKYRYDNVGQLVNDYNYLNINPSLNFDDVRGMTTGQKALGTLSLGASGALTGLSIGGPWGALAGGVIGTAAGAYGWITGDKNAESFIRDARMNGQYASINGRKNAEANTENYLNDEQGERIVSAKGGKIRRHQSIQEFADRILNNRTKNEPSRSAGIERQRVDGGLRIRIKR